MSGIYLRQSTASQSRALGPYLDDTDFKTPETALTIANTDIKLVINGAASVDKNSGGGTHRANGNYGITFNATDTATVGEVEVSSKVAGATLAFKTFYVLEEAVYDAMFAAASPGYLQPTTAGRKLTVSAAGLGDANMLAISDDTTAADNLELQYDTTGLAGETFPATQAQLSSVANVGSATHVAFTGETLTTPATTTSGSFADTEELDGVYMNWDSVTGGFEAEFTGNIGAGIPSGIKITGYLQGNNDDLRAQMWDYQAGTPAYKTIGAWEGGNSGNNKVIPFDAFIGMVGIGANLGDVKFRLYNDNGTLDTPLGAANIYIDQIFTEFSASSGSTVNAVYFDSTASNTNTTSVDGTPGNPVSTEAAVNTLLSNRGLHKVEVAVGSSITFTTGHTSELWEGNGSWALALGGVDISNSTFIGADSSGISTGTGKQIFKGGSLGAVTLPDNTHVGTGVAIAGKQTLPAGDIYYDNWHSGIAGNVAPEFEFGAVGATNLNLRHSSGGAEFLNMGGTDTASLEGDGQVIYNANCTGGAVSRRGDWKATDNASGAITETLDDNTANVADILVDTNELQVDWTNAGRLDTILDSRMAEASINTTGGAVDVVTLVTTTTTNTDMLAATDIVSNGAITTLSGAIVNVDLVDTTTTNTDMLTAAAVNAEVVDAINVDTYAEPGQGTPGATISLIAKINYLYKAWRNKSTQTATVYALYNDDAATVDQKATVSDDTTTATKTEVITGP